VQADTHKTMKTSTTVAMKLPTPHDAAAREHRGRDAEAHGATGTTPCAVGRSAPPPRPTAPRADASRGRAAGGASAAGVERRQRAGLQGRGPAVVARLHGEGPRPHAGQEGSGPHRQRARPIPPRPAPDLVLLPTTCARGGCPALGQGPAGCPHRHHRRQRGVVGSQDPIGWPLVGGAHAPPDQQPAAPCGVHRLRPGEPPPVIPARALRALPGPQPGPAAGQPARHERVNPSWPPIPPDRGWARHGQPRGVRLPLSPPPPSPVMALPPVPCPPWRGPPGGARAGPPRPRQGRRGRHTPRLRHTRLGAAVAGVGPRLGPRALPVPQGMAPPTRLRQPHADLAVVHRARRATVWAGAPAACRPWVSTPVASRPSTASAASRGGTSARRRSARTASGPHRARRRSGSKASGVGSPLTAATGQRCWGSAGRSRPCRAAIARWRGAARSTSGATRRSTAGPSAAPPCTAERSWSPRSVHGALVTLMMPPGLKGRGIMIPGAQLNCHCSTRACLQIRLCSVYARVCTEES
jgi:hypothetical protein